MVWYDWMPQRDDQYKYIVSSEHHQRNYYSQQMSTPYRFGCLIKNSSWSKQGTSTWCWSTSTTPNIHPTLAQLSVFAGRQQFYYWCLFALFPNFKWHMDTFAQRHIKILYTDFIIPLFWPSPLSLIAWCPSQRDSSREACRKTPSSKLDVNTSSFEWRMCFWRSNCMCRETHNSRVSRLCFRNVQQTWDIDPVLSQCCDSVVDAGPTLDQHRANASCLLSMCLPWWHVHMVPRNI